MNGGDPGAPSRGTAAGSGAAAGADDAARDARAGDAADSRRGNAGLVAALAAAAVPLVLGLIVAGAIALSGDRRELVLTTGLAAAAAVTGLVLSVIVGAVVAVLGARRHRRQRDAARLSDATRHAFEEGRELERSHHRRFLARLDHELKNPITAIRASIVAYDLSGPAASPQLAVIDDQARRLATLVGDLRKLSELETRPLELEPVDLESLVKEAMGALQQQRPEVGGRLSLVVTRVPWSVPAVNADIDLLSLAIDNVLTNAAKFSPGGPIEVRLREEGGWAVLDVADSGRGVPEPDLPVVFDELARASNARDVPGSGLGLTLVATVLRRHGGDVTLRSRADSGTVVTMRLPTAVRP